LSPWVVGIVGGSGLYDIEGLERPEWRDIESAFGQPSDALLFGRLSGVEVRFLPRHGRGHHLPPTSIDARANIDALKRAGCTDIVSVCAVGSLKPELSPGSFVVVDQYIDRTFARERSFFGPGLVAHVSMADPVCPRLSGLLTEAAHAAGAMVVRGGAYLAMEGPQFSTRAESQLYRAWGASVIGMTGMPEARLAREAELPYASLAMVTDYDAWRADDAGVEVGDILTVMRDNAATARQTLIRLIEALPATRDPSPIDTCLDQAILTPPSGRDPALAAKLAAVAGRVLNR
jgi:5'-methylthioadenosine phosphorylase